jgi:hypothetical protein
MFVGSWPFLTTKCTVYGHCWTPNVLCMATAGHQMYCIWPLLDTKCTVYGHCWTPNVLCMATAGHQLYCIWPLLDTKCTVYGHCWTPNVLCMATAGHQMYCVWPLMDAKCNLLRYSWHHSICYTSLFTALRVVITISPYNEFWPSDVLSRSGALISSSSECWQLTDWLTLINWLLAIEIYPLKQIFRTA